MRRPAAPKIAEMAGFTVPSDTSILVTEIDGVGKDHPLSAEKLSPVLSLFFVKDFAAALDVAESILRFGGAGHTCGIYSKDDARIREFALRMPAMRVLCNTPTPQGSVGITTNLFPAMTLGCGAVAGNSTGDNISPLNLINIKRLAYAVRKPEDAFEIPATTARPRQALVPATIDKPTLVAAVERYLAQRGVPISEQPSAAQPNTVVDIVDRFLQSKRHPSVPASAATCGACAVPAETLPASSGSDSGAGKAGGKTHLRPNRGLCLRARRPGRHPELPENLHRAKDDRHAICARPRRPA